jgi:hypothetical protein
MSDPHSVASPPRPGPVHRLTFDYEGDRISLVSDQLVNMISPPSDTLDEGEVRAGFTVIVRDAEQRAVYRRTGVNPMGHDTEVFSDDPTGSLQRIPVAKPTGTFVVLVPHVEGAVAVELLGHPRIRGRPSSTPRHLARFALAPPATPR